MSQTYRFEEVARLPRPGDNVAVAIRILEAGTVISYEDQVLTLDYTVMEGHRFAVKAIAPGEALLSWELPFGVAIAPIQPGSYVVNKTVLTELSVRPLGFSLPAAPNFSDQIPPFVFDESMFQPTPATPRYNEERTFMGYRRCTARGVGTRNMVVILGTTSRTGSYAKQLAARLQSELHKFPHIEGIVPVAHTEGGVEQPNNKDLLLRTLAGFMVNPNVGAVLAVDYGVESVTNEMVEAYARAHHYPLDDVLHRFVTLSGDFQDQLALGESIVREWLPAVDAMRRTPESIRHLKIGLQCGGSDAFSGISANPLLGWISEELVRYGCSASLAETDELIGAEPFVLQRVSSVETARKFLSLVDQFRTRAAWHGANAEGNPSGGNKYRGLYNIYLKSIGAAQKKDPMTRLDYAIDYGEMMPEPGFYFMDSPGNDLESIAGQVAGGCNMIFFTTGNGSITNFPYVPTVKVVTTSRRFELLSNDMDVNAGTYLEGTSMDTLGKQTFELTIQVASGQKSVGEKAGHAQVQIWRNWAQKDGTQLESIMQAAKPTGVPIPIQSGISAVASASNDSSRAIRFKFLRHRGRRASGQVALLLPTSLCASQVANMITQRLNKQGLGQPDEITRFVTLPHTEGCGSSGGELDNIYARTMVGYVTHPLVKHCLLLEHGCEKTHNDYMRDQIHKFGADASHLGFASIQLDGGIDKVTQKVEAWFANALSASEPITQETVGLEALRVGIITDGTISTVAGEQLAALTRAIVGAGGVVVVPEHSKLLKTSSFKEHVMLSSGLSASHTDSGFPTTLGYGEHAHQHGFHVMETQTEHWVETVTGMAATGVELFIALTNDRPMQTHPLVPMIQVASEPNMLAYANDMDLLLQGDSVEWTDLILERCQQVIEQTYVPRLYQQGNIDFQFTRGLLGVSL
jgi:altronate dehydratase